MKQKQLISRIFFPQEFFSFYFFQIPHRNESKTFIFEFSLQNRERMSFLIHTLQQKEDVILYIFFGQMRSKKNSNKVPNKTHVHLTVSVWKKDSHGLYDYESTADSYRKEQFYIEQSSHLYRDPINTFIQVQLKNDLKPIKESYQHVAEVKVERNDNNPVFKFEPLATFAQEQANDPTQSFYRVIRENNPDTTTNMGYAIQPGDIVKMGRVEYMVIEMKTNDELLSVKGTSHFNETSGVFVAPKPEGSELNCKICLCNEESPSDPLISPCKCRGTCQKIHVGCLKQWINSKVKKDINEMAYSYNFTKFQCEICKYPFPRIVRVEDKDIQMMTISKPTKPYVVLESLANRAEPNKEERCLHMISAKENTPIRIGRGHQCEIRITDISVSRSHAQIVFQDNKFYIKDQKSKFGTLIKFREPSFTLERENKFKIQLGRFLYELEVCNGAEQIDTQ